MKLKKTSIVTFVLVTFLITGCVADPYNQGNYVDVSLIKGKEGVWGKKEVEQAIGSPSFADPNNPCVVYYVGLQGYKYPIFSPTVQAALTLKVEYDSHGRLKYFTKIE